LRQGNKPSKWNSGKVEIESRACTFDGNLVMKYQCDSTSFLRHTKSIIDTYKARVNTNEKEKRGIKRKVTKWWHHHSSIVRECLHNYYSGQEASAKSKRNANNVSTITIIENEVGESRSYGFLVVDCVGKSFKFVELVTKYFIISLFGSGHYLVKLYRTHFM